MEKIKSSKSLKPADKRKTSSAKNLRQPANPKRKKAEEEVERFASFPKLNPNPVLEVDSSGKITFHNDAAVAVLKKFNPSEDVSVFLPEDIQEILTGLKQKREGQFYRELIMKGKVFEETIYLVPQFNSLRIYAVDITERKRAETALQVSESKYRSLFANMISGFAYHQILLNKNGKPVDYVFLEINTAFEKLTGLKRENIIGKRATEIIPEIENDPADWIRTYGNVALTGKETTFENYSEALKKWFSVSAYSPQKGYFVAIFDDITERKRAEEALSDANERYELVLAGAEAGLWDWNVPRHKVMFSPRWKAMRGFAEHEVSDAEEEWSRGIHPEDAPRVMAAVQAHFKGKTPFFAEEYRVRCKDGSWIWIADRGVAQRDAHRNVVRMAGSESDITKRKIAEEALRTSENRYRELVQNANSAIIRWSRNGTITFFNEYAQDFFGWSADEAIGKHIGILVPEQESTGTDLTGLAQDIVDHPERYVNNINENICRNGCRVWMAWTNRAILDEEGQVTEILAVGSDITERTQKEEELRRLNRTLKALGKSSKAMMRARNEAEYLNDVCRIIVEDCGHAMVWIGFAEDDDAKTVRPVAYAGFDEGYIKTLKITWADTERGRGPTGTAIRTGQPSICRNMCRDPFFKPWREEAIKRGYASSVVVPLMDGSKAIGSMNIYSREPDSFTDDEVTLLSELAGDLTYGISSIRLKVAHIQTEESIKQSEERYRSLVEVSPDAVFVNRGDQIVFANPAALQLFGATDAEQVLGKSTFEMFEPSYHPIMRERIETLLAGKSVPLIESRIVRLDGTMRDVEVAAAPFNDSAGRAIQVILRDITDRKLTENALHDAQRDLNRAQIVAHTGSWRLDVTKNELLWSDENWRIFGVPIGTALTYETFLSTIHPDDREYVDKQWSAALRGEPYDIEHRIVVDGQVKWVREKAELEFDADSNLKGGFGTTQDITEIKQVARDLQTLMEELKRSNSDLEQFAYAASHDLQEPLRVVAGFVSLLEKKYKEKLDDKAHEYIEYSIDGVKRMQVLIKDLLAYSQVGTKGKTFKPTICSVALEQAIYNLHTAIEESGAEITYDSLPTVSADTSQLIRLFQNLIGNAIKFRAEERLKIHITAERKGNEWVFSIQDNGIGIDPNFFDRIFVVFQRLHTREEYEGTGIGLAVCKKIVERHGGHIWVESEQGKGTTFYFTMPVME